MTIPAAARRLFFEGEGRKAEISSFDNPVNPRISLLNRPCAQLALDQPLRRRASIEQRGCPVDSFTQEFIDLPWRVEPGEARAQQSRCLPRQAQLVHEQALRLQGR